MSLNRRFAPDVYLEVVKIRGSIAAPTLVGHGPPIEYAVKMREFSQQCLLSRMAENRELEPEVIDAMARVVADLHLASPSADPESDYGSAPVATKWSEENLCHIASAIPAQWLPASFDELRFWYEQSNALPSIIQARKRDGFVRDCHGDLHLGNLALLDNQVTPFDCIEFEPELRWIDTISEVAFVAMDLAERGYPEYCWRFISRYFEASDDYAGVNLLRYYFVYRALVRAKVEALRADQASPATIDSFQTAIEYIELAKQWALDLYQPAIILMHGLSGSGKSTVAGKLVEAIGAFQVRSDVVRKRLFGLAAEDQTGSQVGSGIYTSEATEATYCKLQMVAAAVIDAGFTVILDATFLSKKRREQIFQTQSIRSFRKIIIDCDAPVDILRQRIMARDGDPSEANLAVLERQLQQREPISGDEAACAHVVQVGQKGLNEATIDKLRDLLKSLP